MYWYKSNPILDPINDGKVCQWDYANKGNLFNGEYDLRRTSFAVDV